MSMTRTYALRKLLEHGPLQYGEIMEITGWRHSIAKSATQRLLDRKEIKPVNLFCSRRVTRHYALTSSITANLSQPLTGKKQSAHSTGTANCALGCN